MFNRFSISTLEKGFVKGAERDGVCKLVAILGRKVACTSPVEHQIGRGVQQAS